MDLSVLVSLVLTSVAVPSTGLMVDVESETTFSLLCTSASVESVYLNTSIFLLIRYLLMNWQELLQQLSQHLKSVVESVKLIVCSSLTSAEDSEAAKATSLSVSKKPAETATEATPTANLLIV